MQSVVHRPQDAHGRLQPLHSLFRLPGQLPAAGDPVLVHRIESGGSVGRKKGRYPANGSYVFAICPLQPARNGRRFRIARPVAAAVPRHAAGDRRPAARSIRQETGRVAIGPQRVQTAASALPPGSGQPGAPAQTLHGLPPMYRQMPVARTETGRNRIRTRRGNAAGNVFRPRILQFRLYRLLGRMSERGDPSAYRRAKALDAGGARRIH